MTKIDGEYILLGIRRDTLTSGVPVDYINALQHGTDVSLSIGGILVDLTHAGTETPVRPERIAQSWIELRAAIRAIDSTGHSGLHSALPPEIALAVWMRGSDQICAYRPGAGAGFLRRSRTRLGRRLAALSPVPFLTGLGQFTGTGVTAIGVAVAPALPAVADPGYLQPSATQNIATDHIQADTFPPSGSPLLPHGHRLLLPKPTVRIPQAQPTAAPDVAPSPSPPPTPPRTQPSAAEAPVTDSPTPTSSTTVELTPSPTASLDVPALTAAPTPSRTQRRPHLSRPWPRHTHHPLRHHH
ncbi:hypothetical protein [Spirillospora sp. NBC_01491]|uniref:hypothetical protein n=1 Tax=Spirillospora sp. NBC_01491 TaxID=2976007 RepID=UPI002E314291|nr:hypothetical protein [Spirillospora sp. NBC_01491]